MYSLQAHTRFFEKIGSSANQMSRLKIDAIAVSISILFMRVGAAMKVIGNADGQETGRRLNNRAENSHQPFRRRELAMHHFRRMRTLQEFAAIHGSIYNHFNQERYLYRRSNFKQNRSVDLGEWRQLCA